MLRLSDLSVVRDGRTTLQPVDLELPAGALVAVTGASGAGKSTLLLAIAGRLAHGGEVSLDGRPLTADDVALVPQGHHLVRVLTARENVAVPLVGRPGVDVHASADRALHTVGLAESGGHLPDELSGGQQQRVALARALAREAPVLLADECTSDLDGANRDRALAALRAEARRGAHVLLTTNDLAAADECDQHLAIDEGVVVRVR